MKNNLENPTIAIIGGGFSGTLVAANLLRNANSPLSIILIEKNLELARGIAYGTKETGHLLNVPAGKMSAFANEPDHFLNWLYLEKGDKSATASSFISRQIYGDYLESILNEAQSNALSYVQLERINDEAIAITPKGQTAQISLSNDRFIIAQKVVLAIGNFPPSLPRGLQALEPSKKSVISAWSAEAITNLKDDESIFLVGSGLTMVDVVISLVQKNFRGKIYAISRHGLTPIAHQPTEPYPAFLEIETAPKTIVALLKLVRQEINWAVEQGKDWRAVLNSLRPISQQIWQALPLSEQKRFLRHLKPYWEVHRHRIAQEIADILSQMVQSGQLIYCAGHIQSCQLNQDLINIEIKQLKTGLPLTLQVNRIINCTGSNCNYQNLNNPLIENLKKQGLIVSHPLSIGIKTGTDGSLIDQRGNISQILYTLGTPRKGDLWETTAVPEIRVQAANLARQLLYSIEIRAKASTTRLSSSELVIFQPGQKPAKAEKSWIIFRQLFDRESSTYTYLIADPTTKAAILIDPVLEQVERDLQVLQELGLSLSHCLETHIHADHITGANKLKELTGCLNIWPEKTQVSDADGYITDCSIWQLGNIQLEAISTPGHTDSHMSYLINDIYLLTGDALLIRGCGRTDFQNGSAELLYDTITNKLFKLPDRTFVYPCHDYQGRTVSTIGEEKQWNSRFVGRSRQEFIQLMNNLNLPYPKKMPVAVSANQQGGKVVFVLDYQI